MSHTTEGHEGPDTRRTVLLQLENIQQLAGEVERRASEGRTVLREEAWPAARRKTQNSLSDLVLEAAKDSEYLTLRLRRLILELAPRKETYTCYMRDTAEVHGIRVAAGERILEVTLPVLVPHRKSAYTDFVYQPLQTALREWCRQQKAQGREIPHYREAAVCFFHEYDRKLPVSRIRDHDNIEEKQVLDILAGFFLESDSGGSLATYHETCAGEKDGTHIYLMDRERFPDWLAKKRRA